MNGQSKLECLSRASFSQLILKFAGKAKSTLKGMPEIRITRVGSGYYTKLERLFATIKNYDRKKLYNIYTNGLYYKKTFQS